ncbi:glycosyltransferase [Pedobacter sp. MR2016-24]|uniref:glycosyltransferase n=1 Tax=Pedobacter sp. MR2016-24 TaxID=2994466 RepID=UPI0022467333|nr:glycosyltransferase family 4 protein [Pedobacter sp. MR2016-24]MCX2482121.1 glycosyltransferase family 4 protein [Pedobacter sp. MR2016-24]
MIKNIVKNIAQLLRFPKSSENHKLSFSEDSKVKTLLVIDDYVPYYDKSSGSKRLFELLKLFREIGFNVIFFPEDGKATLPYYDDLKRMDIEVLISTPAVKNIALLKQRLDTIDYAWISRPALNHKYQKLLRRKTKTIFDTVDLHYLRMLRQAENHNDSKLKKKALKTKKLELGLAVSSNATIVVTEIEKNILAEEGIKNVTVIPNVHETVQILNQVPFPERKGLLFIGGYKHDPNIDAVKWLINDIMPMVWHKLGDIPVYLLGSDPSAEVLALASEKVIVPGYLNDVSSYFLNSRVFIAPLRYGAGMKGKIGQSLEFGLPIVSTAIGLEGMNLTDGLNVLSADDSLEFSRKIILLYNNEELWSKINKAAYDSIQSYSPENVKAQLKELFTAII